MSFSKPAVQLVLAGRSGDGKSTLGNAMAKYLTGANHTPFVASASATSCTQAAQSFFFNGVNITDLPGLLDSKGRHEDAAKIRALVVYFKQLGSFHALVLAINERAPRCDGALQSAIKLLLDCFGKRVLSHIGIAFTLSFPGLTSPEASRAWVRDCSRLLSERTGYQVPEFPSWQLDSEPEALAAMGVAQERIAESRERTNQALFDMLQWARTKPEMPTADMVAADYDEVRELKEEKKGRELDNTVVKEEWETTNRVTGKTTTPIMATKTHHKPTLRFNVGFNGDSGLSLGISMDSKEKTYQTQVGTSDKTHKSEDRRRVQTLGNGRKVYGEWEQVRKWDE